MKYRWLLGVVLACATAVLLFAAYEMNWGGKPVASLKQVNIFDSVYDAAYERAINRALAPPLASIGSGEQLALIWDSYGKDFWACYVRTSKGVRGWTLCNYLDMS
jgi:predicted outer membrane lipoprotein